MQRSEHTFLIYIQQDATLHILFYLETALHVSGVTITHHQECKQLYLQHLVFVTPYCYLPLSWESWNWFECAFSTLKPVGTITHHQESKQLYLQVVPSPIIKKANNCIYR
jgi:hypothetical protein